VDEKTESALRRVIQQSPADVIRLLLEENYWPKTIETKTLYQRYEDDSPRGTLGVGFSDDADGWIEIISTPDEDDFHLSMRFRMPFVGGGQSPRVRNAIGILAEAIRLDNEDHPQHRHLLKSPP
jgi:hypothetical protein